MADRPRGLTDVAILTVLGGVGLFFYAILTMALGAMGHAGITPDPAATFRLQTLVYPPLILSLLAITAAVGTIHASKWGWYLSMLLWILSSTYLVYAASSWFLIPPPTGHILIAVAILANIVLLVYFQSGEVKTYFHAKSPA